MLAVLAGCESAVFDSEGDCAPTYRLHLSYTRNMKWADAFPAEVTHVGLYAFNQDGSLAWSMTETAERLRADGYDITLPLDPGVYDIVVWCGGQSREASAARWNLSGGSSVSAKSHLTATLETSEGVSSSDIHRLYHGSLMNVVMPDAEGIHDYEIDLTKDTNFIRVILQHADGEPVNKDWFTFAITDTNGSLDHTNAPASSERITYRPWSVTTAATELPADDDGSRATTSISSVIAEMTTSRLVTGNRPVIEINCTEPGNEHIVARLDLISYFLMIKGSANRHVEDQEFLDRQDDYSMMLILDDNNRWNIRLGLYINSWRIVKQEETLQ